MVIAIRPSKGRRADGQETILSRLEWPYQVLEMNYIPVSMRTVSRSTVKIQLLIAHPVWGATGSKRV